MSCILHIETSTTACSVAVSEDGQNIFRKEELKGPSHSILLGVFVDEALSFADSHAIPLDAVAVSCGPGSYTGLRIGVSMAKGVCYGRNLKLIGLPTLEVMCVPVLLYHDELPDDALLCPCALCAPSVPTLWTNIRTPNSWTGSPSISSGTGQTSARRKSRTPTPASSTTSARWPR